MTWLEPTKFLTWVVPGHGLFEDFYGRFRLRAVPASGGSGFGRCALAAVGSLDKQRTMYFGTAHWLQNHGRVRWSE